MHCRCECQELKTTAGLEVKAKESKPKITAEAEQETAEGKFRGRHGGTLEKKSHILCNR